MRKQPAHTDIVNCSFPANSTSTPLIPAQSRSFSPPIFRNHLLLAGAGPNAISHNHLLLAGADPNAISHNHLLTVAKMISSKKRKRGFVPNPFIGVFTRSKSRIYSHPNRSGRSRLDFSPHVRRFRTFTRSNGRFSPQGLSGRMEVARPFIKDLRSRRIFSPPSVTSQCLFGEGTNIGSYFDDSVLAKVDGTGPEVLVNELLDHRNLVAYSDCGPVLPDSTPPSTKTEIMRSVGESESPNSDGQHLDDESGAQLIDKSAANLPKVDDCFEDCNDFANLGNDDVSGKTTVNVESNHMMEKGNRCNSVLGTSARRKIFTDPSSFSYKRLLPYIMSMPNDRSKNGRIEKVKEKSSFSQFVSFTKEATINKHEVEAQEISVRKSIKEPIIHSKSLNDPLSRCNDTTKILPRLVAMDNFKTVSSSFEGMKGHENFKDNKLFHSPASSCQGMHDIKVITEIAPIEQLEKEGILSPSSPGSNVISSSGDGSSKSLLTDSCNVLEEAEKDGCVSVEDKGSISKRKPIIINEEHVPLKDINDGFSRGILKRNPRGCRGLCTCLNCSSFRLHAVRSFEFSQNQMQDTEDIASSLIKELLNMQSILGKVVQASIDNASSFDTDKIKEACRRASVAEEVTKGRLEQMNDDLNAHYRTKRLERPRVNFAYSEEIDPIQSTDL